MVWNIFAIPSVCIDEFSFRNVDDIKTLYLKRESGAPNVLDPKYTQLISFLLMYDPKLEVEIKEDGGQNAKSNNSAVTTMDKPYVIVLGILGQHFPPNWPPSSYLLSESIE